jgi:dGTPase
VDRLEKRYDEPGLNLTHDVREGMLKHTSWPKDFPFPLDFPAGLRFESGGTLEAQAVNWSDEIAQQTHDLEDGLPLTEEAAIEELEIARVARSSRGYGRDAASRRAALIRGMIATLSADLVEASRTRIERWLESSGVATTEDFYARRDRLPGDLIGFSDAGRRLYAGLREFVYRHIIHSFPVSRHDGHARRVLAGLFAAYRDNPRLLPDDVLRGLEAELGVRFLREVPLGSIEGEVAERYRPRPEFYRAIADHIAGMTDSYCNSEYHELVVD